MPPKLIAIVGPTASGKTGLAIEIAKFLVAHGFSRGAEIISVDSRQVYRGMNIGTAKVRRSDGVVESWSGGVKIQDILENAKPILVDTIPHWGIDLVDPDEDYSVAEFKEYAERKIDEILKRKHVPILVGGTGLWLSALIDNFDLTQTAADPKLRVELEVRPLGDLFAEYKRLDPDGAEVIDRENKRRVVRALEVTKVTGKPFSKQQTKGQPKYDVFQIGLLVDREELNKRIDARVDEMVANGLVDEVRRLKEKYGCDIDAMTGIGYRQMCMFLEGKSSLVDAITETKKATRQYAKRQMTWFKRDKRIHWVSDHNQAFRLLRP